ncbi:hypothetical protein [Elizabethkingia ursingii]|uniref:Major fimbrial subunit protein N-terminal domain-containing protein n=1 Tax=Elizabethkingia ursingii TaxID=1756150 RepID=A0ABX3ND13_9FLAO|nr:hypothetical protein [Elizabethkingia ursingii]OPB94523.1 hypothetical protein BB021_18140 [Elizabethkingia ursingii]
MKFNNYNKVINKKMINIKRKVIVSSLSMLSLILLFSCRGVDKGMDYGSKGEANVKFKVSGLDYEVESNAQAGLKKSAKNEIQSKLVKFSKDIDMLVEVKPDDGSQSNLQASGQNKLNLKSAPENTDIGMYYRVVAYEKAFNKYLTYQDYIVGSEATAPPMKLLVGHEYIFVAYSYGQNVPFPESPPTGDLANNDAASVQIKGLDFSGKNKLFYFIKDDMGPLTESNTLNIIFKARTAMINMELNSAIGNITALGGVYWGSPRKFYEEVTFSMKGIVNTTPYAEDVVNRKLEFPTLNTNPIVSNTFYPLGTMFPDEIKSGNNYFLTDVNIQNITINGITKSLTINNVKNKRGIKYKVALTFKFSSPIIKPEVPTVDWGDGDGDEPLDVQFD